MRTVFIGCGHMARVHIPYVLKIKDVQLAAVCDRNEIRAKELARKYNIPYFTDTSIMLDVVKPEAVHVLTPPQTHAELAIQSLEAGSHVLIEKPLCLTPQEADAIYTASKLAKRLVSVNHTHKWSPLVQKAIRVVNSGNVGQIKHIQYVIGDDFLEAVKGGYALWACNLRGGIFCDLIPHPLYLIRTFLPNIQLVSARACGTDIHDLRELWVDLASIEGRAGLWMSLTQRPLEHTIRIYCTKGTIYLDLRNFLFVLIPDRRLPGPAVRLVNTLSESWQRGTGILWNALSMLCGRFDPKAGTAGAMKTFYEAIVEGKSSPVSMVEGKSVVGLSTAIWNMLEGTHGSICQIVDEKNEVIAHKKAEDFTGNDENKIPKVLVTGGTGFIGRHLVRKLIAEGQQVRVLCRPTSNLDVLPTNGVELSFGDVSDLGSVRQAMQGVEVLYHLAATTSGDWASYYYGTVVGTQNVLQAATEEGVKKAVYVSSLGVLHASRFPNGGLIDENFPLEQDSEARGAYSQAKLEAEQVALKFAKNGGLPVCIVRPGLVYGVDNSKFLSDAGFCISDSAVLVIGMGKRLLGLTYVENLVNALLLAMRSQNSCGKIYHIVDHDQPTVQQYIRHYRQFTGQRLIALYIPSLFWTTGLGFIDSFLGFVRGSSPNLGYRLRSINRGPRYDTKAAQEELGWKVLVSLEERMKRTFGPHKEGR